MVICLRTANISKAVATTLTLIKQAEAHQRHNWNDNRESEGERARKNGKKELHQDRSQNYLHGSQWSFCGSGGRFYGYGGESGGCCWGCSGVWRRSACAARSCCAARRWGGSRVGIGGRRGETTAEREALRSPLHVSNRKNMLKNLSISSEWKKC